MSKARHALFGKLLVFGTKHAVISFVAKVKNQYGCKNKKSFSAPCIMRYLFASVHFRSVKNACCFKCSALLADLFLVCFVLWHQHWQKIWKGNDRNPLNISVNLILYEYTCLHRLWKCVACSRSFIFVFT